MAAECLEPTTAWTCRDRTLTLRSRPLLMGILNATPDSFSDGGHYIEPGDAVAHGRAMLADGADIIDVGGESTRPGSQRVGESVEIQRTQQVVQGLCEDDAAIVSIDTTKASVARAALDVGARIVNDISACEADPAMVEVVAESGAGVVLMHRRGTPETMQDNPAYEDVLAEVEAYLLARAEALESGGVSRDRIVLDPGIGFGKLAEHNIALLLGLDRLAAHGYPVLVGLSRKSLIGALTGKPVGERLAGSVAGALFCAAHGASVLRVHDVGETDDALRVYAALSGGVAAC